VPLEAPAEAAKDRTLDEKVKVIVAKVARPQYSSRPQRHQNEFIEVPCSHRWALLPPTAQADVPTTNESF
jgi:hypothetical protein